MKSKTGVLPAPADLTHHSQRPPVPSPPHLRQSTLNTTLHFKYKHLKDPITPSALVLPNELQLEMGVRFVINYFPFILIYVTLRATNV